MEMITHLLESQTVSDSSSDPDLTSSVVSDCGVVVGEQNSRLLGNDT